MLSIRKIASKYRGKYDGTPEGDQYRQTYRLVDIGGVKQLEPDELIDMKAEIQSHAESVDFNNIINHYLNGDDTALIRAKAFYADVSGLPKKMQEIMAINSRGKEIFEQLPTDLKNLYNDNYFEFLMNPSLVDEYMQKNFKEHAVANVMNEKVVENGE